MSSSELSDFSSLQPYCLALSHLRHQYRLPVGMSTTSVAYESLGFKSRTASCGSSRVDTTETAKTLLHLNALSSAHAWCWLCRWPMSCLKAMRSAAVTVNSQHSNLSLLALGVAGLGQLWVPSWDSSDWCSWSDSFFLSVGQQSLHRSSWPCWVPPH